MRSAIPRRQEATERCASPWQHRRQTGAQTEPKMRLLGSSGHIRFRQHHPLRVEEAGADKRSSSAFTKRRPLGCSAEPLISKALPLTTRRSRAIVSGTMRRTSASTAELERTSAMALAMRHWWRGSAQICRGFDQGLVHTIVLRRNRLQPSLSHQLCSRTTRKSTTNRRGAAPQHRSHHRAKEAHEQEPPWAVPTRNDPGADAIGQGPARHLGTASTPINWFHSIGILEPMPSA